MPRVASPVARARGVRPRPSDATDAAAERAYAAPPAVMAGNGPSSAAAGHDLLPAFAPTTVPTAWLASLAAASTRGEMAAVGAAPGAERDGLLLFAEAARALHQLLDAVPRLDHAARFELSARVERMASWLAGERGARASAAVALCEQLGAALTTAPD